MTDPEIPESGSPLGWGWSLAWTTILFLSVLWGVHTSLGSAEPSVFERDSSVQDTSTFLSRIAERKDTIYVLGPHILSLDLSKQKLLVYHRDAQKPVDTFRVSTGTTRLKEGIETRPGIYVIRYKARSAISTQFDDAVLINWMVFNNGIGFHALEGRSYYRFLGVRPSSHGCVRMSHAGSDSLYRMVTSGTPVIVFRSPMQDRVLAFLPADVPVDTALITTAHALDVYRSKLASFYNGSLHYRDFPIIPLLKRFVGSNGLPVTFPGTKTPRPKIPPSFRDNPPGMTWLTATHAE